MWRITLCMALLLGISTFSAPLAADDDKKDQPAEALQPAPVPLDQAAAKMSLPEGFRATLCAGEPDVRQPIGFAIDDRGRLWVAECYAYPNWKAEGSDRILIFEDADGDGRFDSRKVFWDQGNYLTGLQLGFGGVWVCCSPHLLFIPDRDRDDVPDGEPEVVLDGWSNQGVHNVLNGLTWGPDGWLYGCNGITAPSKVGAPGTPENQRLDIACGIWRIHPTTRKFEVVAHGTTNPWGLDWDDYGQGFFTNCVIGHLWHLVPGGHYKRMFGNDYDPHVYGLLDACSDHLHWGGGKWTDSRGGKGVHSLAGGGHAHSGAMVYLGDNWPADYRNSVFLCNIHGNRVNHDTLARNGSGYVGRHGKDFLMAHDEWFRGLELKYGPDGGVYLIDWSDTGECHERDAHGAHHDSGRIYKVTYKQPQPVGELDVAAVDDAELVKLHTHRNAWYPRHARRVLQERAAAGQDLADTHAALTRLLDSDHEVPIKLRALWTLYATGGTNESSLRELLTHDNEHVRHWAVRLLCDTSPPGEQTLDRFATMAAEDPSPLVRLALASALQRLPLATRWPIAENLLSHGADATDANLPLMIWYGIEPLVATDKVRAIRLTTRCKIPLVREYIARRAVEK